MKHAPCIRAKRTALHPHAEALARLINRGSFHGNDLVMSVGCADNVALAEDAIRRAEAAGWIERGKYDPSREQRFFGIGGFPGDRLSRVGPEHRSAVAHHWITKTFIWIEPEVVDAVISRRSPP